jgi:hypothetical protein
MGGLWNGMDLHSWNRVSSLRGFSPGSGPSAAFGLTTDATPRKQRFVDFPIFLDFMIILTFLFRYIEILFFTLKT